MNRAKDFAETRKHEQEMERQVMQNVRRMAHDTMSEKQDVRVSPSFFVLLLLIAFVFIIIGIFHCLLYKYRHIPPAVLGTKRRELRTLDF